jgi:hypothetical protein
MNSALQTTTQKIVTTSPHQDTHRREMRFEVVAGGKLKRIGRHSYFMLLRNGLAVEMDWEELGFTR